MIVYGYAWMGVTLALFVLCLYGAHGRTLLRPAPLVVLAVASGLAFALRVLTYMQFLQIVSFHNLEQGAVLFAAIFGAMLLIGYTFVLLAIINLLYPRNLGAMDLLTLSCLSGFGISMCSTLYGIGKLAVERLLGT
ncbi:MAG: hypothetical protein LBC10_03150 [Deltaproteobacteria bacterium]|jgi:hypothetical protein|nr:hypothetical protein [Deltaproteobacteria bacterium]